MSATDEVIPSARRLVRSLRDMGYDFTTAVADLVDNSLEAEATVVTIDVEFEGDESWVRIIDNGHGMTEEELVEAMRYGSDREYDDQSLGKFGLGLKTASMSQCQSLTVASRIDPDNPDIVARCWDFEHIENTDKWEVIRIKKEDLDPAIRSPLEKTTGTVVFWQKLDRILGYKHPYGEMARKRLATMCRDLEEHLAMVFHKFLLGEIPERQFRIILNGNEVTGWDPFARNESKTQNLPCTRIECVHENVTGEVLLQPYILPPQYDFSTREAWDKASGPKKWNQQQGFYVYRNGRMIQSGGWSRIRTPDEHTKLARIALSFSPVLDEAFKINVSKMRVYLPSQIREEIENEVGSIARLARLTYDRRSKQTSIASKNWPKQPASSTTVSPAPIQNREQPESKPLTEITVPVDTPEPAHTTVAESTGIREYRAGVSNPGARLWTLDQLIEKINEIAEPDELPVIVRVFHRLRDNLDIIG